MQAGNRVRGLYAITPQDPDTDRLRLMVSQAIDGGAGLIQYRDKSGDGARRREQALVLAALCRARGAGFIVNDDMDLALEVRADGVHLGRDDPPIAEARRRMGPGKLIGASCYDRLEAALSAAAAGADYVAFGSFFPSAVKPLAVRAPLGVLRDAKRALDVPLVAIGGITQNNAAALIEAGADAIAVLSAVFGAPDVQLAAARLCSLCADRATSAR